MTIFNDKNRTVEIVITTWDETIGQICRTDPGPVWT